MILERLDDQMLNRYKNEINQFKNNFGLFKKNNIILYGIGRYTATLIENVKDFYFVGLMDKNPENIGKIMFGLPIVDLKTAEQIADLIIINTSETYWNLIYNRISESKIPIFYKNGERAVRKKISCYGFPYKSFSLSELKEKIYSADVISFDFFDTLFSRKLCNPKDVMDLVDSRIQTFWNYSEPFSEVRIKVIEKLQKNYTYDDLYHAIEGYTGFSHKQIMKVKKIELDIEEKLLEPRMELIECLQYCKKSEKEIYLVSDMYFSKTFYENVLRRYNLELKEDNILISNEINLSKKEGNIWNYVLNRVGKQRKVLHIGDNVQYDVEVPKKYGIDTYLTPDSFSLFCSSAFQNISSRNCTLYASVIIGMVKNKLFGNPHVKLSNLGQAIINTGHDMGYAVFGPVILTFLFWLIQKKESDSIKQLIFMSRDGYFLIEDYKYLCSLLNVEAEVKYLGISRQLAMMASIESEDDLMEYMNMPYSGNNYELFKDRLDIEISEEDSIKSIEGLCLKYQSVIQKKIKTVRMNYLKYLKDFKISSQDAIVDLGFYGNNQRYLNKLLNRQLRGYYFNASLTKENPNCRLQKMEACFQKREDCSGEKSNVLKKMIFIESFLTAPYGMVKEVKENGTFICDKKKKNQLMFNEKEEINQGVKDFICEYCNTFGKCNIPIDIMFVDDYYGECMSGALQFSEKVKKSFYNDNAMMNRFESPLFY